MQQSNNTKLTQDKQEISLQDIYSFIKKSWKITVLSTFFGFFVAIAYLQITPPSYEAVAQIQMAQISQVNPSNPFGTPIEDPNSLIARMKFPTNYSEAEIRACGYQDRDQAAFTLAKDAVFSNPRGVANTVELKILAPSRQIGEACANAIFLQIVQLQERFSKVFVEEAKIKLASDNERIEAARRLIAKADQSGNGMSAIYLSARDELAYFLIDREKMVDLINSVQNRGTKLASPIYISEMPVTPKKNLAILIGLVGGFFLGITIALGCQVVRKLKSDQDVAS